MKCGEVFKVVWRVSSDLRSAACFGIEALQWSQRKEIQKF